MVDRCLRHYGDGHGRGMNPPTPFVRWHPLNAMTAGLVIQALDTFTSYLEANDVEAVRRRHLDRTVTLSPFCEAQPLVSLHELADKQLRIVTTFGGADFNIDRRHDLFPFVTFQTYVGVVAAAMRVVMGTWRSGDLLWS